MDTTTQTTITDAQIRTLRDEAIEASDYRQSDLCNRALSDDTVDQDGNAIPFAEISRDEARESCADAIRSAQAQS